MSNTKLNPPEMSPHLGLFSHIVCHKQSGLAFISGQIAIDKSGAFIGKGDAAKQIEQVFKNIESALSSLGEDWRSVISLTTYLASSDYLPAFKETRKRLFDSFYLDGEYPAHTLLVVAALSSPDHLVEIEAVVSHSSGERA